MQNFEDRAPTRPVQEEKPMAGNIALTIPKEVQRQLKAIVEPRYPTFKGEHITVLLGVKQPSQETTQGMKKFENAKVEFYGVADDNLAVQCLLVRVNGETLNSRGKPYHATWSLNTDTDVPGAYNSNSKPSKAKARHSEYIATQEAFITLWNETFVFTMSAEFYPEAAPAPNAGPAPQKRM